MPNYHCISFERNGIKIPLKLSGTFSYLYFLLPNVKEINYCDKVFITLDSDNWNPQCGSFQKNDNAMTKFEGDIMEYERRADYAMEISDENDVFQN